MTDNRVHIAVYDAITGVIRQVVECHPRDAALQHHAWPGHDFIDVTGQGVHPNTHSIDPATKKVGPYVAPLWLVKRRAEAEAFARDLDAAEAEPDMSELTAAAQMGTDADRAALGAAVVARKDRKKKHKGLMAAIAAATSAEQVNALLNSQGPATDQ